MPVISTGLANVQVSSVYDSAHDASRIRLNFNMNREGASAWHGASLSPDEWVQLSTPDLMQWNRLVTQGRGDRDQWVTSYTIEYTANGVDWVPYDKARVFLGNIDRNTIVVQELAPPIVARCIKLKLLTFNGRPALRLEAYVSASNERAHCIVSPEPIPAISAGLGVTVSSVFSPSYDASRIRLNFSGHREGGQGWTAAADNVNQWVQISSIRPKRWVKVCTQGVGDSNYWVNAFYLTYSEDGNTWRMVDNGRVFDGNNDKTTVVTHLLHDSIIARVLRLHPTAWTGHIGLRMEAYFFELGQ